MHRKLSIRLRRPRRDERGAIAILAAAAVTGLLVLAAMVIDFGIVRLDRQVDKSAADAAAAAGMHGLDVGDGSPHPFVGVCSALRYLQQSDYRFRNLTSATGTWKTGLGVGTADGCTNSALRDLVCKQTDKTTWAVFTWQDPDGLQGEPLKVRIESGYAISSSSGWSDDKLTSAIANQDDNAHGCDQVAVEIQSSRAPGIGSLASTRDLTTGVRSVGRVKPGPGSYAPAMLLLNQSACPVLKTGSSSGGSFIHVQGAITSDGLYSQPGTIHSDSAATETCGGSNKNTFLGFGSDGVVAYAAPLTTSASSPPDTTKPGSITSYASYLGLTGTMIRDSLNNVYGSNALTAGGTKSEAGPRARVTRSVVDDRYRSGVQQALSNANLVFGNAASTYTKFPASVNACKPTQADVTALSLTSSSNLYIDCSGKFIGDSGGLTINAGRVYFRGWVNPAGVVKMPNANHVYVENTGGNTDAISVGNGATFQMNTSGNTSGTPATCTNGQNTSKAILVVKTGDFKETGTGSLQMCRTTVYMMGGMTSTVGAIGPGCVPTSSSGVNPAASPCPGINGGLGTGQFTQQGGGIDWTAPDRYNSMLLANGNTDPAKTPAWTDPDGQEDLALWSESGTNSSNTYNLSGGSTMHVRGVFMVPNANPFQIGGNTGMVLTNAQFVASTIILNGTGTNITMSVDPYSAISFPSLAVVGLVR